MAISPVMSRAFRFKSGADASVILNRDIENELAVSAESPDATTWTLKLRPGAQFQNVPPVSGRAVEGEDVKASFVRAVDAATSNPSSAALGMIDPSQIQAPAKDTVVFKLKFPYAPFPKTLASPTYSWIYPREGLSGAYDPAKKVIGSGPFLFDTYTPDVAVTYKRNPEYFEQGLPYVDSVRYAIVPDYAQQLAQFTALQIDIVSPQRNDVAVLKQSRPNATYITAFGLGVGGFPLYFQMGDRASPFQDIRLRRAVSLALDRTALNTGLDGGEAQPAFAVPLGMGKWALKLDGLDSGTRQYFQYDLAQAKQLIQAAGASGSPFTLAWPPAYGPTWKAAVEAYYNMLAKLPWKLGLATVDYSTVWMGGGHGMRYGYYPSDTIVFGGVSAYTEADEFIFNYYDSQSPINVDRLGDPKLDAMLDQERAVLDESERVSAMLDMQKYIAEQMYAVEGLPQVPTYTAVQPWVRNYNYSDTYGPGSEVWAKLWLDKRA